jgi:hypothetical protein
MEQLVNLSEEHLILLEKHFKKFNLEESKLNDIMVKLKELKYEPNYRGQFYNDKFKGKDTNEDFYYQAKAKVDNHLKYHDDIV